MQLVREVSVLIRTGRISTAEGHVVNVSNYDVSLFFSHSNSNSLNMVAPSAKNT